MAYDKPPQDPIVYTHQDFGAAYFDANLPNSYERMWMVARAINFDFHNYNKFYSNPDRASKKRFDAEAEFKKKSQLAVVALQGGDPASEADAVAAAEALDFDFRCVADNTFHAFIGGEVFLINIIQNWNI